MLDLPALPIPLDIQDAGLGPLVDGIRSEATWAKTSITHMEFGNRRASSIVEGRLRVIVAHHGEFTGYPHFYDRQTCPAEQHNLCVLDDVRAKIRASAIVKMLSANKARACPRKHNEKRNTGVEAGLQKIGNVE